MYFVFDSVMTGMRGLQGVDLDNWIEKVRRCQYLQEDELKALCEYVRIVTLNLFQAHFTSLIHREMGADCLCCRQRKFWLKSQMSNP